MLQNSPFSRPLRFAVVGALGVLVNSGVLYAGHEGLGLPIAVASPLAIAVAIFHNFNLNNFWTWRSKPHRDRRDYLARMLRYYLSSSVGAAINYALLLLLVQVFGVVYLAANLAGIACGMLSNYLLSEFWVFRRAATANAGPSGVETPP